MKHNRPTLVKAKGNFRRPGPKWIRILGYVVKSYIVTIPHRYRRKAATYGHKPINLRNEVTPRTLSRRLEQAAKPQARGNRMPSEANASGNAEDMLTEGGYSGWSGYITEAEAYDTRF